MTRHIARVCTYLVPFAVSVFATIPLVRSTWAAASCIDHTDRFQRTWDYSANWGPLSVSGTGTTLFLPSPSGLIAFDVSDPTSPLVLDELQSGVSNVRDAVVQGDYAFAADLTFGLRVIDLQDPSQLSVVGSLALGGSSVAVAVEGSEACVASMAGGVHFLDVTNPAAPTLRSTVVTSNSATSVAISGGRAYVTVSQVGLQIYDLTGANVTLLGTAAMSGPVEDVDVAGAIAYVARGTNGLDILNVSNGAAPLHIGGFDPEGVMTDLDYESGYVYAAGGAGGVHVIDVSNPFLPSVVLSDRTWSDVTDVQVLSGCAAVSRPGGISILAGLTEARYFGSIAVTGLPEGFSAADGLACGAYGATGFRVFDVSNPSAPVLRASRPSGGQAHDVDLSGNYAYLANGSSGLTVVDLSSPTAPVVVTSLALPGEAHGIEIDGARAYVTEWGEGLQVIDISTPNLPVVVGSATLPIQFPQGLSLQGDRLYVADFSAGVIILDVSVPSNPLILGSLDTPEIALDVAADGTLCYAAFGAAGLAILDVSNPALPYQRSQIAWDDPCTSVAWDGAYVYAVTEVSGLHIVDVTNPDLPVEVSTFLSAQPSKCVRFSDGQLFYTPQNRIYLLKPHCSGGPADVPLTLGHPSPLRVAPNPFRDRLQLSVPPTGAGPTWVLDATGREVMRLNGTEWDGRDASGRSLPSGVYYLRAGSSDGPAVRVVRVR